MRIAEPEDLTGELVRQIADGSSRVLLKKLSTNDRQFAIPRTDGRAGYMSNQAGPLLPAGARDGFFPELVPDPDRPWNRSADVRVYWPTAGLLCHSRFIWYSRKGDAENHLTTHPRGEFADLSPASWFLLFRPKVVEDPYVALTIDAADEELTEYLIEVFGIGPEFRFAVRDVASLDLDPVRSGLEAVAGALLAAWLAGPSAFDAHVRTLARRSPAGISQAALADWKRESGNADLDPYRLERPGDVIEDLIREREFALYRQDEAAFYGAGLVRVLLEHGREATPATVIETCLGQFGALYDICRSAKQARSSRVGKTFETHMATALGDGGVPHVEQILFGGSRPDFVLPDGRTYRAAEGGTSAAPAIVLTLKTTLRERWRQIVSESQECPVYLGTLDESVTGDTLDRLAERDIVLVVPERHKASGYSEYEHRPGVITWRSFFDLIRDRYGDAWRGLGYSRFGRQRTPSRTRPE